MFLGSSQLNVVLVNFRDYLGGLRGGGEILNKWWINVEAISCNGGWVGIKITLVRRRVEMMLKKLIVAYLRTCYIFLLETNLLLRAHLYLVA